MAISRARQLTRILVWIPMRAADFLEDRFQAQHLQRGSGLNPAGEEPVVSSDLYKCCLGIMQLDFDPLMLPFLPGLQLA